jgi:hypothetical protein
MLAADDPRHGTANGYCNLKCRCDACRNAWREWMSDYNHRTGRHRPQTIYLAEVTKRPEDVPHGTNSRYRRGCRCDECRARQTALKRDWRRRTGRT